MKEAMKQLKWHNLIMAVAMIIMGIALIVYRNFAMVTICMIVGIMLMIGGIASVLAYLVGRRRAFGSGELVLGVIEFALGIFITVRPASVINFLGVLFAAILVLHGIGDIAQAVMNKGYGDERWLIAGCLGVVSMLLGVLILWNPFTVPGMLIIIIGVALIYAGVVDLMLVFRVKKYAKMHAEIVEDGEGNIVE